MIIRNKNKYIIYDEKKSALIGSDLGAVKRGNICRGQSATCLYYQYKLYRGPKPTTLLPHPLALLFSSLNNFPPFLTLSPLRVPPSLLPVPSLFLPFLYSLFFVSPLLEQYPPFPRPFPFPFSPLLAFLLPGSQTLIGKYNIGRSRESLRN